MEILKDTHENLLSFSLHGRFRGRFLFLLLLCMTYNVIRNVKWLQMVISINPYK